MIELGRVPFRLRVGVTGHRQLVDEDQLAVAVQRALTEIRALLPPDEHTSVLLTVVSPLAEGADRLVAREVLNEDGADLEAVLPLETADYVLDFTTEKSRGEFEGLLARAVKTTVIPRSGTREDAYDRAGRLVVDRSDVMIAVWNGERAEGHGGTAEIVTYALERNKPVAWVSTTDKAVKVLGGRTVAEVPLAQTRDYNSATVEPRKFAEHSRDMERLLAAAAEQIGIEGLPLQPLLGWLAPYYTRADMLAVRYQGWYYWLGNAAFLLAAAAVAVAATQILFLPERRGLAWIEVGVLVTLLAVFFSGRIWRLHERWLSYRFLAERFRSALFLVMCGLHTRREGDLERLDLGHHSEDWLRRAFGEVWKMQPALDATSVEVAKLRAFLGEAWLHDQLKFYSSSGRLYKSRHARLSGAIYALFAGTIVAAALHGLGVGGHGSEGSVNWANTLKLFAIALPALGAALSGIRSQREYERNAERYDQMVHYLANIRTRMQSAPDMDAIRGIAAEAEDQMLDENRDWFVVMKFHDFELHP